MAGIRGPVMRRRRLIGIWVLLVVWPDIGAAVPAEAGSGVSVPQAVDLREDARVTDETGRPLMLVWLDGAVLNSGTPDL